MPFLRCLYHDTSKESHKPLAILGKSTLENNESTESSWSTAHINPGCSTGSLPCLSCHWEIPSRRRCFEKSLHIRLASLWSHDLRVRDTSPWISLGISVTFYLAPQATLLADTFPCLAYGIQLLMPGLPYTYQRCGWLEERSVQRVPKGGFSGFALYRRFIKHFVPYTSLLS